MREFIIRYLQEKKIQFKEANDQFILERCEACGDSSFHHFYMHQEVGTWDCKKCGSSGGFNDFRKLFGDTEIDVSAFTVDKVDFVKPKEYRALHYGIAVENMERLWSVDTKFKDYLLNERKLTEAVLKQFKIGGNGSAISIPIYENDVLVNMRYRRDPSQDKNPDAGPKYSQEKGCKASLFNGDVLREPLSTVTLTEGEFDAMQLIQRGFKNVVSVTLGAGYFPKDWIGKFEGVKVINIIYDSDEAGRAGAKKAAEMLGVDRCKIVVLPLKEGRGKTDITNYFVDDGYSKTDFVELIKVAKSASSVSEDSVKHVSEFTDKLRKILLEGTHLGEKTGYDKLDDLVGGFRKGRLIVISGRPNSGKTSFALSIASNMALRKLPVFYFSLEMPPIDIVKKLLMIRAFVTSEDLKVVADPSEVLEKIDKTFLEFKSQENMPTYLYNGSGMVKYSILAECARLFKENYAGGCIFVDHLHYFAHNYNNVTQETSQVVRQIKQLAIQLDIPIVLLAHLHRDNSGNRKKGLYIPTMGDLKDTSTIEQDADQVIFVARDSENEDKIEREKVIIKLAKNRDGYAGRSVSMVFNEDITAFVEVVGVDYEGEHKVLETKKKGVVEVEDLPF